jgi:LCP family protein required for cell wall assembly
MKFGLLKSKSLRSPGDPMQVNLLPEEHRPTPEPTPQPLGRLLLVCGASLVIVLLVCGSALVLAGNRLGALSDLPFIGRVGQLVSNNDRLLKGEPEDRVNIVLIGIGGKNHEGGTLADTIIVASLKPSTKQVAAVSIPRDLTVQTSDRGQIKINAVHAYAEKETAGSGGPALSAALEKVLGVPIQYYVTVDFDGFEKLIDEFGGVDVDVERDLIDYEYPIRGREDAEPISSRYETLNIKKGPQHMDGALALKYARSRHALGGEGSDFARSKRQQKIIAALKSKILSGSTFLNPRKLNSLYAAYRENVTTNLEIWEALRLADIGKDIDPSQIISQSLTDAPTSLLYATNLNGAYVLLPRGNNFDKISAQWRTVFTSTSTLSTPTTNQGVPYIAPTSTTPKPAATTTPVVATTTPPKATTTTTTKPKVEHANVEIYNGTFITGWATREADALRNIGLTILKTGNTPTRDYTTTIVYDQSNNKYPETTKLMRSRYGSARKEKSPIVSTADYVIILGKQE